MMIKIFSLLFLFISSGSAFAEGYSLYADKILELEQQGHINKEDAHRKVYDLRLKRPGERESLKRQARGVASAIGHRRIIKIKNAPIEISFSKIKTIRK